MRAGWRTRNLGDLFEIRSSKRVHERDWADRGVPFFRAREIVKLAAHGSVENALFIPEELFTQLSGQTGFPQPGDLMVTAVGTLGACYVVTDRDRFYFKDASVLWLIPKTEVDSRFAAYAFRAPQLTEQVANTQGATVGTLTISRARSLKVPIPSPPEQKRVVAILDDAFAGIDAAIANTEKNLANARELFESCLDAAFRGGNGWMTRQIRNVADISYGYTQSAVREPVGPRFLRITDIQAGTVDWQTVPFCPISETDYEKHRLKHGDIVFARTGATTGKSYLVIDPPDAVCASYLIRLRASEEHIMPALLSYVFQTGQYWTAIRSGIAGSAQGGFNASKLGELAVRYPGSTGEQKAMVDRLDQIAAECRRVEISHDRKRNSLAELKQSLLQKAFAGELTAKEAEKQMAVA